VYIDYQEDTMPVKLLIPGLIIFLHDMFTALWIGGLGFMAIVLIPGIKQTGLEKPQMQQTLQVFRKKFRPVVLVSIIGLFITGMFLTRRSPLAASMFSFANIYSVLLSVKHILIFIMIISVIIQTVLGKQQKSSRALTLSNFIMGTAVVLLSGITAAISSAPKG